MYMDYRCWCLLCGMQLCYAGLLADRQNCDTKRCLKLQETAACHLTFVDVTNMLAGPVLVAICMPICLVFYAYVLTWFLWYHHPVLLFYCLLYHLYMNACCCLLFWNYFVLCPCLLFLFFIRLSCNIWHLYGGICHWIFCNVI